MRLNGMHGKRRMCVLVDLESTHKFLSEQTAHKLEGYLKPVEGVNVAVANSQDLQCRFLCKNFEQRMQGQDFCVDVTLYPGLL